VAGALHGNRSFIPVDLQKEESDLIFRGPFGSGGAEGGEVWVYVLLEHQSEPDPAMPLRLYLYIGHLWDSQRREWERKSVPLKARRLDPVIPLVFYTGEKAWSTPLRLADLMDAPAELKRFVPDWETLFLNLHRTPPETLGRFATAVGRALQVLRAEKAPLEELERVLKEAMTGLEGLAESQVAQWLRVAWYLVLLVFHRRDTGEYTALQQIIMEQAQQSKFRIREEAVQMGMTMAEFCRQEGEARGRTEGEARGEARGLRQALEEVLAIRFGPVPADVRAAIEAADAGSLRAWHRAALTADSLAEVAITPPDSLPAPS